MAVADREMSLRDYWAIVLRRKWLVVAAVLMALLGSLAMSLLQTPIYEAEAQMLVEPRSGDAVFGQDPTLAVQNLERAIQTEIQVLEGQKVRARVQADLELEALPPGVRGRAVGSTDVVSVTVRSEDPATAQALADAYVAAYIATRREQSVDGLLATGAELQAKITELQGQIDAAEAEQRPALVSQQATFKERLDQLQVEAALVTGGASVVKSAELPTVPTEPRPVRSAALAGMIGLLLGLGIALLVDHLDDSLRAEDDLAALTDAPVLAVVPVERPPDNRPIALSEPHEFAVEIYRGLRTNVQFLGLDAPLHTIQITSALPGEGKTTTASNLAVVLAQAGHDVVLVDADLRKPRLHEVFSVPAVPGLTEVLLGESLDMATHDLGERLHLLTAGAVPPNPADMMNNPRAAALLRELAERYTYVVIDTAPILPVADALTLSRSVDGVLVVAQAARVSRRNVAEALSRLERVGAPLFGVVLNQVAGSSSGGEPYGYGYGYGYGHRQPPPAPRVAGAPTDADATPSHGRPSAAAVAGRRE